MTTTTTDVTGMRIAHRMMTTDLVRLADVTRGIADDRVACPQRRAAALATWTTRLADEIHHHHRVEDDAAWPVIERHAGPHVDLTVLSDDHAALDPLLDAIRAGAARFVAAPDDPRRRCAAGELTGTLATLRDHLGEHNAEEEASLFPVIERHVPPAEWAPVEKRAQQGGAGLAFTLPRALAVMSEDERRRLFGTVGPAQRVLFGLLARVLVPRHRRRERLVFTES